MMQNLSWTPLQPGGANFKTANVRVRNGVVTVTVSAGMIAFCTVFIAMGLMGIGCGLLIYFIGGSDAALGWIMFIGIGTLFAILGIWMLASSKPFKLDKAAGLYYRGFRPKAGRPWEEQGALSEIRALQVLAERCTGSASGARSYTSYEINLVCHDGKRVHVLDHGDRPEVDRAAADMADYLKIPVWRRDEAAPNRRL